jgi:hypothetical protein
VPALWVAYVPRILRLSKPIAIQCPADATPASGL